MTIESAIEDIDHTDHEMKMSYKATSDGTVIGDDRIKLLGNTFHMVSHTIGWGQIDRATHL